MEKCGVCGKQVEKSPCVNKNGKCTECHEKLKTEK